MPLRTCVTTKRYFESSFLQFSGEIFELFTYLTKLYYTSNDSSKRSIKTIIYLKLDG